MSTVIPSANDELRHNLSADRICITVTIFRDEARLFKMRGQQRGWGADRDSKWRLSMDPCIKGRLGF